MNALLFLLAFAAMLATLAGHRPAALALFACGLALSVAWLLHHATSALPVDL
jgi:hypothetical protein